MFWPTTTLLVSAGLATAAQVGYFDSDVCVDPSGMESCYEDAQSAWADCVDNNCEGQNIDCSNVCSCIHVRARIDCAAAHCWNQVYSCEYQETAGEVGQYCLDPDFTDIPHYPPPDDAPAACSCNLGKLVTSIYQTTGEIDSCGRNGEEMLSQLQSNDEIQAFVASCVCCAQSAQLSAFYDICPETDPSTLGINEVYQVAVSDEEEYQNCPSAMSAISCGADGFDFTPPGGDSSANFYEPGEFPSTGTLTTSNMAGSITAPVSGETFTWTYKDITHEVTVASPDARPTNNSGSDDSRDDGDSNGNDSGSNDNSGSDGDNSNDSGDDGGNDSDNGNNGNDNGSDGQNGGGDGNEDAAAILTPQLLIISTMLIAVFMM